MIHLATTGMMEQPDEGIASSGLILNWDIQNSLSYAGTGSTITDLKGNSNGTLVGTIDYTAGTPKYLTVQGGFTEYIRTAGLNAYLSPANTGTAVSLFLWVYPTGDGIIVEELGTTTLEANWHDSQIEIVSGQLKFRVWQLTTPYLTSNTAITLNTWNYVGFTYSSGTLTGYLNANIVGSTSIFRQTPFNDGGGLNQIYALGARDNITNMGAGNGATFRLGAFHVYNRAIASKEVNGNYNATKTAYGL